MRLFAEDALHVLVVGHTFGLMIEETFGVKNLAALILEREIETHVIDWPRAEVGDFAGDHQVRRHAARVHNLVARDVHLQIVVLYDLRLGMIIARAHVRLLARLFAVLHSYVGTREPRAGRSKDKKSSNPD